MSSCSQRIDTVAAEAAYGSFMQLLDGDGVFVPKFGAADERLLVIEGTGLSELATLGLARATDAREIAEMSRDLIEQGLTWSWTPWRVQHFISGPASSVVVARRERHIAAFAIMHFGDEVAHLNLLAVAPEHRRQGLGRQLMDWLTRTAIEAGVFRINLELRKCNEAARIFYESLGFDGLGVVQGYYQGREAALRMSRYLAKSLPP